MPLLYIIHYQYIRITNLDMRSQSKKKYSCTCTMQYCLGFFSRGQTAGSHQSGVDSQDGIDELLDSFIDPPARFIDLDQRDVFSPDDDQEIKGCTHYTCLDIYR